MPGLRDKICHYPRKSRDLTLFLDKGKLTTKKTQVYLNFVIYSYFSSLNFYLYMKKPLKSWKITIENKIHKKYKLFIFFMKFKSYNCVFIGNINGIHTLINGKTNREIPGFFKISWDTYRTKKEPWSRELNPNILWRKTKLFTVVYK